MPVTHVTHVTVAGAMTVTVVSTAEMSTMPTNVSNGVDRCVVSDRRVMVVRTDVTMRVSSVPT